MTWKGCLSAPVTSTAPGDGTGGVVTAVPVVGAVVVDPQPMLGPTPESPPRLGELTVEVSGSAISAWEEDILRRCRPGG